MDWCRLTSNYYQDPGLVRAGEAAEVLFTRMLAYCADQETRGLVPRGMLPSLAPTRTKARIDALIREGLVLDMPPHDVLLRSWERIQEAHDTEAERRRKDRERKAQARAAAKDKPRTPATSRADVSADSSADSPQTVRAESARIEVEVEEEEQRTTSSVEAAGKPPKRATRIPDAFPADDEHRRTLADWAREHTPAVDLKSETDNWQDWHRAKGDTAKDWTASWRTWMRRAQKDAERRPGPSRPGIGGPTGSTTDQRVARGLELVQWAREHQQQTDQPPRELGAGA